MLIECSEKQLLNAQKNLPLFEHSLPSLTFYIQSHFVYQLFTQFVYNVVLEEQRID